MAGIKEIDGAPVGDTLTDEKNPCSEPLPGFREVQAASICRPVPGHLR